MTHALLQDPAVESLSSFIGVDAINTTPNSGRLQINLKPLHDRQDGITDVMARLQARAVTVSGIDLHMQAAQDLTVEDRVSRTQYQFSLEHPDQAEVDRWGGRLLEQAAAHANPA